MTEGIKRRDFLKVLGVGGASAGLVGCSTQTAETLLPYVVPPENITPGVATWYTTVCGECAAECGMWVRTREGRAVKVEGNPNHAVSGGALCARGHSSIQGLYTADRFPGPKVRRNGALEDISWDEAEALLAERLQGAGGNVLLINGQAGPTLSDVMDGFVSAVGGSRVEHDGLSLAPLREATRIAFGRDVVPHYDIERARFLVSFGADFLETWVSPVAYGRAFARMSGEDHGEKGEFVFVAPRLSLTGQNADEWVPIRPGAEAAVALGMAAVLVAGGADAGPYAGLLRAYDAATAAAESGVEVEVIQDLARRFVESGPSLALGPGIAGQHRNATAANLAVHVLNAVAGNVGATVHLSTPEASASSRPYGEMESAIGAMAGGNVDVVMVHGTNPAFTLPAASGFVEAFGQVPFKVSFASEPDETAALADLILPDRHFLEAWGDSSPRPGVFALRQPVMQPVPHFETKQTGDVLLALGTRLGRAFGPATTFDHLRARWQSVHALAGTGDDFETWWKAALRLGAVTVGAPSADEAVALREPDAALTFDVPAFDGDGEFALLVYPSSRFGDGRQASRPWMLELPDPVSKITWHSWVEIHPDAAERLGVRNGDIVSVTSPHGALEVPVWTYPGIREDTVALAMGSGRQTAGRYGTGRGVNVLGLLPAVVEQPSGALVHMATRVSIEATGERHKLATIEGADTQHDRNIAPAVALSALGHSEAEEGEHGEEEHGLAEMQLMGGFVPVETEGDPTAYPLPGAQYGDYANPEDTPRWGMAIDLDKCTGCSACVVACQSENNVPWVGEDQVAMGRDLAWIRVERYYETVDAHHAGPVDVRHLPMMCQHCGNAPCEPVCPVFAAYHTPDGMNGQIYNRCVGTRYCANNCPYKVRVFNWYTYTDVPEPMNWAFNPDVTVRQNGVMEKCSFCVQRVRETQNKAVLEGRAVRDGEIVTACQQSCPAEAIVFGDLRDPESAVSQKVEHERTYRVLDELINTQPGVNYMKKVTFHEVASAAH
jgi:molybdopterin-containing oxidoreductase family iron-sulfur binding subunit